MFHKGRAWNVGKVESPEELADKLVRHTWTLCTGFVIRGREEYLFLNDSTSEDGAGEYGIVKALPHGNFLQVESVTFSWCSYEKALHYIQAALAGEWDKSGWPVSVNVSSESGHRCGACA